MRPARYLPLAILAFLVLLAVGSCAVGTKTAIPSLNVPAQITLEERNRENPVPMSAESVASGRQVFSTMCIACHGVKGGGDGELAKELNLDVPNFRSARRQESRTDGELFYIITKGHGSMPGQGDRWSEEVRWNVVNFIRSLQ